MVTLKIHEANALSVIPKEIYGNFSEHLGRCIYGGVFVGKDSEIPNVNGMRTDVVEALKELKLPVLRWPGGCFADEYHWRDGIGELKDRKKMVNTNWGGVTEDNSFGTHEFMELCSQIGCEPYINGNVGSGTVQEMSEWVEYMTFDGISPQAELRERNGRKEPWKLKYFGVGNENWGCGGNMRPEYYADEFRRYQTFCRNYGDNKLFKIACGANARDYNWTEVLMKNAAPFMDGLSLHYYTVPGDWEHKGSATDFSEEEWYTTFRRTLYMETLLKEHSAIMDKYDPDKRVALVVDEWGTWYDVEPGTNPGFLYQQNSMRDALVAGINLNLFQHHTDRVRMANIAQLANVLQAVVLTEGVKMVKTPTYHVFRMFVPHQGATAVSTELETSEVGFGENLVPQVTESVSLQKDGSLFATLNNLSASENCEVFIQTDTKKIREVSGEILTAPIHAYNTFTEPDNVTPSAFTAYRITDDGIFVTLPPASVAALHFVI